MKRKYTHVKEVENEMMEMKQAGKTNREIADHFGFADKWVVKRWGNRYNKRQKETEAGSPLKRRGRPAKGYVPTETEMRNEIKRLKMENALLRDFLRVSGTEPINLWLSPGSYLARTQWHPSESEHIRGIF